MNPSLNGEAGGLRRQIQVSRLRRPCDHVDDQYPDGHYQAHHPWQGKLCPGGEFLPEDALVDRLTEHFMDSANVGGRVFAPSIARQLAAAALAALEEETP